MMNAIRIFASITGPGRGPKRVALIALAGAACAVSGCETARKLAPGGFLKVETVERDVPDNEEIATLVRAGRLDRSQRKFPRLSEISETPPALRNDAALTGEAAEYAAARDRLAADVSRDAFATDDLPTVSAGAGGPIAPALDREGLRTLQAAGAALSRQAAADLQAIATLFSGAFENTPDRDALEQALREEEGEE
ncbi:MAG: hypothetical protein AAFV51_01100 [Pseudomonadota bacterium]